MTVSQRAHEIRQTNPSMSWGKAMKQANKEIYLEYIRGEGEAEQNAEDDLQNDMNDIEDALTGVAMSHGFDFSAANDLVDDIIYKAIESMRSKGFKHPNIAVDKAIKEKLEGGYSYISETVFSSTGYNGFIAFTKYKDRITGKVSQDWFNAVKKIAEALDVDISSMPTYSEVSKFF